MGTLRIGMIGKRTGILPCCFSVGMIVLASGNARADEPSPHPGIGGHVGLAVPLVTITSDNTTTVSDQFTLAVPIGIGFKLGDKAAIDFETVVSNPISPRGTTGLTVDPGIIYDLGPFVIGLRLALKVQADTNFGLIPLIHKGIADIGGGANWFVEAAFPSFINIGPDSSMTPPGDKATFEVNVVLHTGIGF